MEQPGKTGEIRNHQGVQGNFGLQCCTSATPGGFLTPPSFPSLFRFVVDCCGNDVRTGRVSVAGIDCLKAQSAMPRSLQNDQIELSRQPSGHGELKKRDESGPAGIRLPASLHGCRLRGQEGPLFDHPASVKGRMGKSGRFVFLRFWRVKRSFWRDPTWAFSKYRGLNRLRRFRDAVVKAVPTASVV